MARAPRLKPSQMVDDWPNSPIADPVAEAARLVAIALSAALGSRSARETAHKSGVNKSTVLALLNGTTWPDMRTVALLEEGLGVPLWPSYAARTERQGL